MAIKYNWNDMVIGEFKDDYFFLSSFYPCIIVMDLNLENKIRPVRFNNAECAYQYGKAYFANDKDGMTKIQECQKPSEARKLGQNIKFADITYWENYKLKWMFKVIECKFYQHSELQIKLLHTFPKLLVEGNYWNDQYWGFDLKRHIGCNNLGLLLMLLRSRLLSGHSLNIINYSINI